ncbi:hypothetical protein [Roseomonas elaeocarpi]|uniref:Uncharacterized protein n=1 Tax=Roseomonas elaeocarpi TaxID=907779 RepID=A0ABV6JN46_9PROT
MLLARRFRCDTVTCRRQIFTERFGAGVLAPRARRTTRMEGLVHHLGLALGGRPAASLARRLRLRVSHDTLLRLVRRRAVLSAAAPQVIGIDGRCLPSTRLHAGDLFKEEAEAAVLGMKTPETAMRSLVMRVQPLLPTHQHCHA